jgi:hypothetical protein
VGFGAEVGGHVQEPAAGAGAAELLQPAVLHVPAGGARPCAAVQGGGELQRGAVREPRLLQPAAAEVALAALARRGPSYSLAARILVSRARGRPLPPILPPPRAPRFCANSFPWRGIFFSSISRGACFKRFSTVEFGDMRVLLVRV